MVPFWFSYALAEAGSPWRMLQHVQQMAKDVLDSASDDLPFVFLLKAFAYNRMSKSLLIEQENVDLLSQSLRLIADNELSIASARYERCLFLLRTKKIDAMEELMPDKKTFPSWTQPLKILFVRMLLKRNTMLTAR
jgi:hypothetical protein